jgi:hypothetical protein
MGLDWADCRDWAGGNLDEKELLSRVVRVGRMGEGHENRSWFLFGPQRFQEKSWEIFSCVLEFEI